MGLLVLSLKEQQANFINQISRFYLTLVQVISLPFKEEMKTCVVIALIASVGLAAAETITGCPDSANEAAYCAHWSNPANGENGQHCTDTPEYMCKCCKGYCSGPTCPGASTTVATTGVSTGKPNGQTCKDDVDCASKHCCGLVTDLFGISTGTCRECCADRHCAAGQKCELEGLFSWKNVCKEKKKWFGR